MQSGSWTISPLLLFFYYYHWTCLLQQKKVAAAATAPPPMHFDLAFYKLSKKVDLEKGKKINFSLKNA